MNRIKEAEQSKIASTHEAEAKYILRVKEAEAERDRRILHGEGTSGQRLAILKGYEEGVQNMSEKLGISPKDLVEFVRDIQHLDVLDSIGKSNNAKTVFINHEPPSVTTGILRAQ